MSEKFPSDSFSSHESQDKPPSEWPDGTSSETHQWMKVSGNWVCMPKQLPTHSFLSDESLTSLEGLILPDDIGGNLNLSAEDDK